MFLYIMFMMWNYGEREQKRYILYLVFHLLFLMLVTSKFQVKTTDVEPKIAKKVADLLKETKYQHKRFQVTKTEGRCGDNTAYNITKDTTLVTHTEDLFPQDIPHNFSILVVAKPNNNYFKVTPFIIYTDFGQRQLVLSLGRYISLDYNDNTLILFDADASDGQWHRLGISIEGDTVTLIFDCDKRITKRFYRNPRDTITGTIYIGRQIKKGLFVGSLEMLKIATYPEAAYEICTVYAPKCNETSGSKVTDG